MKYTDIAAIANRLEGRLNVGGMPTPYGKAVANDDLLTQIGGQVEAKVEAAIAAIYVMPLQAENNENAVSRPIMASLIEKGVVCELADVHFFNDEEGSSYGREICRQFRAELSDLVARAVRLPGEQFIATLSAIDNPGYSRSAPRTSGVAEAIQW